VFEKKAGQQKGKLGVWISEKNTKLSLCLHTWRFDWDQYGQINMVILMSAGRLSTGIPLLLEKEKLKEDNHLFFCHPAKRVLSNVILVALLFIRRQN
jgi:hypothetical protein